MIGTGIVLILFTAALLAWLAHAQEVIKRRMRLDQDIAMRGLTCQGRVFAVQRPFLFESTTRLYFEFAPPGAGRPVQCCHLERGATGRMAAMLPSTGMLVDVRYLPESPTHAVIGKLLRPAETSAAH
jgi:hypothetical protein